MNAYQIQFVMFKICGGVKVCEFNLTAISENHAVVVATDFYNRCGLIGRYYCELSNGKTFSVNG